MRFLEENADAKAIYIYPTKVSRLIKRAKSTDGLPVFKALAQDQRGALEQLLWSCEGLQHIKVATYDGDTPLENRAGKDKDLQLRWYCHSHIFYQKFEKLHQSFLRTS